MFKVNIEKKTLSNKKYRNIAHTTHNMQLVYMSLKKDETIPREIHKNITQFIRVEKGKIKVIVGDKKYILKNGDCIIIEPNTYHEVVSLDNTKLYTIYTPPAH